MQTPQATKTENPAEAVSRAARAAQWGGSSRPSTVSARAKAPPPGWTPPTPLPAAKTHELFARFAVRYPLVWASQYVGDGGANDDDALALAMAEWSEALAGVTEAQIRAGFRADHLRADHWPPGPSEFAAMCHGIPTLARVKHILSRSGPQRTRFTRLVWSLLDTFQFTRGDGRHADKLLAEAYELAKAHVMSGHPLPEEPSGAIEHKPEPRTPAKPETVKRALETIRVALADAESETEEDDEPHRQDQPEA